MKEVAMFIYNYYKYYIILSCGICASIISLQYYKQKISSIGHRCFTYVTVVTINMIVNILVKHHIVKLESFGHPYIAALIVNCLCMLIVGFACVPVSIAVWNLFHAGFIQKIVCENKWGLSIFTYLFCRMLVELPEKIDAWVSVWYATDYSMGLGSRFFIGTILKLFYDDYLDQEVAYRFCIVILIIIIGISAYLINYVMKTINDNCRKGFAFFLILFLVSPGFVPGLWELNNLGRLETYGLLISLFSIVVFEKLKSISIKYVLITFLSCISMAIYQGNIFMFYPIILVLFVHEGITDSNNVIQKRVWGGVSTFITCVAFLFFQFCSCVNFSNAEEMIVAIQEKSNVEISEPALDFEVFQSVATAFQQVNISFLTGDKLPREKYFMTLLLILPIIVLVMALYLKCREYRVNNQMKIWKCPYIYYILLIGTILPQYILNIDWGRWLISSTILVFCGIVYLLYKKDSGMNLAFDRLSKWFENHTCIGIMCVIFIASLGSFKSSEFIDEVEVLVRWLTKSGWIG